MLIKGFSLFRRIGYILPKNQWDIEEPFAFGEDDAPYGKENSLGPETAPLLHKEYKQILKELAQ